MPAGLVEGRPRHSALLLGRLGLEPGCSREDLEIQWLRIEEEALAAGWLVDTESRQCYELLQDERRWVGRAQGRRPVGLDKELRLFLLENGMQSLLASSRVRDGLVGITVESLPKLNAKRLAEMGFSPRHR